MRAVRMSARFIHAPVADRCRNRSAKLTPANLRRLLEPDAFPIARYRLEQRIQLSGTAPVEGLFPYHKSARRRWLFDTVFFSPDATPSTWWKVEEERR